MESKISERTYVSIGLIITFAAAIWYVSGVAKQTQINTTDINEQEKRISDLPTRVEYNDLKKGIDIIQADLRTLLGKK